MTLQPETRDTDAATPERSGLNRRTVLKAGAHAAWAIPAVQVITQAPALAASGDSLSFSAGPAGSWQSTDSTKSGYKRFKISALAIKVTSSHGGSATVTVTLTFPTGSGSLTAPTVTGWTAPTVSGLTATYTTTAPVSAGSSTPGLTGVFVVGTHTSGTIQVTGNASGFSQAVGSIQA